MTHLISQSMNHEAVYRTAPGTPGLLITRAALGLLGTFSMSVPPPYLCCFKILSNKSHMPFCVQIIKRKEKGKLKFPKEKLLRLLPVLKALLILGFTGDIINVHQLIPNI